MGARQFFTDFEFRDKVNIDGSAAIEATILAFAFYEHDHQAQVSWWNTGTLVTEWVAISRLSKPDNTRPF